MNKIIRINIPEKQAIVYETDSNEVAVPLDDLDLKLGSDSEIERQIRVHLAKYNPVYSDLSGYRIEIIH